MAMPQPRTAMAPAPGRAISQSLLPTLPSSPFPLSCNPKTIKILRIVPGNPAFVDVRDVLSAGEHFHCVRPGGIPMRIVRGIEKFAGADAIDHVGYRRFLQFKSIEELVAGHVLAGLSLQERRFP